MPTEILQRNFPLFTTACTPTTLIYAGGGGGGRTGVGNFICFESVGNDRDKNNDKNSTKVNTGNEICTVVAISNDGGVIACGVGCEAHIISVGKDGQPNRSSKDGASQDDSKDGASQGDSKDDSKDGDDGLSSFSKCSFVADSLDRKPDGPPGGLDAMSFKSNDGDGARGQSYTLATGGSDCTVRVWSVNVSSSSVTSSLLSTLAGHTKSICSLQFNPSPKSPLLASSSKDATCRVWDYTQQSSTGEVN